MFASDEFVFNFQAQVYCFDVMSCYKYI